MQSIDLGQIDWARLVRPGDTIVWGQGCGEPLALSESLLAQRHSIPGRFGIFLATCYSRTLSPDQCDVVDFTGLVGTAGVRPLSRRGLIDILPIHYGGVEDLIEAGRIACDVALVQVSPPDGEGRMSPGIVNDYIAAARRKARLVVAEVNARVPWTHCDSYLTADDIAIAVRVDRPPVSLPRAAIGSVEKAIAANAVDLVPERAVVQPGIGAIPDAILLGLKGHRDLGIHAGSIGDGVMDLMQCGAVTNAMKPIDRGVTVTGNMIGSEDLFGFAHRNPSLRLSPPRYTHNAAVLAKFATFISINGALEVDLTGQVNSEAIGRDHVGTIGGQVDFVRAAAASPGGRSIIALSSTTSDGNASRIVAKLSGPVTTPRSDVDVIVTEWGRAELRARSQRQRAAAMIAIAHPSHREALARAARDLFGPQ